MKHTFMEELVPPQRAAAAVPINKMILAQHRSESSDCDCYSMPQSRCMTAGLATFVLTMCLNRPSVQAYVLKCH